MTPLLVVPRLVRHGRNCDRSIDASRSSGSELCPVKRNEKRDGETRTKPTQTKFPYKSSLSSSSSTITPGGPIIRDPTKSIFQPSLLNFGYLEILILKPKIIYHLFLLFLLFSSSLAIGFSRLCIFSNFLFNYYTRARSRLLLRNDNNNNLCL